MQYWETGCALTIPVKPVLTVSSRQHEQQVCSVYGHMDRLDGRSTVQRNDRTCPHCADGSVGDEHHIIFECTKVQGLRQGYCHLFGSTIAQGMCGLSLVSC